jgi:hypothetical protein
MPPDLIFCFIQHQQEVARTSCGIRAKPAKALFCAFYGFSILLYTDTESYSRSPANKSFFINRYSLPYAWDLCPVFLPLYPASRCTTYSINNPCLGAIVCIYLRHSSVQRNQSSCTPKAMPPSGFFLKKKPRLTLPEGARLLWFRSRCSNATVFSGFQLNTLTWRYYGKNQHWSSNPGGSGRRDRC